MTTDSDTVSVPQRWVDEVVIALDAATRIGQRSCREGDHLHYGNHDRLLREAGEQGYSIFVPVDHGGPTLEELFAQYNLSSSS